MGSPETVEQLRQQLGELTERLDRFSKFVEGTDDLLTEVDHSGRFVYLNKTAEKIFGLTSRECVGRLAFDFIHPEDREPTMAAFGGWVQQRVRSADFENRQVSTTGQVRHMHWTINPHYDDEGNVVTITSIARDVTVRKEMEQQLRRTGEVLEQKVVERTATLASEKERLAVTLRSIGDGVITTDAGGRITLVNEAAEALTGWSQEQARGKDLRQVFHIVNEQTRQVCEDPVALVLKTGAIVGLANNTVLVARDGSERIIADSGAPIRDSAGEIIGVVLVFRDTTEKRRAERRIARQAAMLTAINEILREAITGDTEEEVAQRCLELAEELTDSQFGFICEVNERGRFDTIAISYTGWEVCRIPEEKRAEMLNDLEIRGIRGKVIKEGRAMVFHDPASHVDWLQPPEGHPPITSFMGVPLQRLGRTVGQIGLANKASGYTDEDLEAIEAIAAALTEGLHSRRARTELKQHRDHLQQLVEQRTRKLQAINESLAREMEVRRVAEEELGRKARELARSNEELEQFAYVASHDLQEPLRMVSSFSQLLVQQYGQDLDSTALEYLAYLVDGATRMQALIRDLLAFSRVSTHGDSPGATDCDAIMERVLQDLKVSLEESGGTVVHQGLPTVHADPSQLVQLFQNLVGNAIKFRGKDRPVVRITAREDGPRWLFAVQDNGIGIEAGYQERIFVIFQRLHGIRKYPGTGIGLALCKKIVQRHGGRIWVESEPGQGSTFHFTLPRGP